MQPEPNNELDRYYAPRINIGDRSIPFTLERAHQYASDRAKRDILFFSKGLKNHTPAPHHIQWFNEILKPTNDRVLIISSRGFGKTETITTLLSWWMGMYPNTTNVIASVSLDQAEKRLQAIRNIMVFNDFYKLVFPYIDMDTHSSKPNTQTELNIYDKRVAYNIFSKGQQDAGLDKTNSLTAFGMGSAGLVGNRFTGLTILDDPHDQKSAYSTTERQRAIEWYYTSLLPCVKGNYAKTIIITTRWHEMDLAGDILEFNKDRYVVLETPAMHKREDNQWYSNWDVEDTTTEKLRDKWKESPRVFMCMYMNDPYALAGNMFQIEWLQKHLPRPLPPLEYVIASVDPAVTLKKRSDFTAIAVVGWDKNFNFYLLKLMNRKMHPKDLGITLTQLMDQSMKEFGRFDKIIIENAAQQVLISDNLINTTALPIHPVNFPGDKKSKASNLESLAANSKFMADWDEPWAAALRSQMLSFPNTGSHDDMVDAIAQGANYMLQRGGRVNAKRKQIKSPFLL